MEINLLLLLYITSEFIVIEKFGTSYAPGYPKTLTRTRLEIDKTFILLDMDIC